MKTRTELCRQIMLDCNSLNAIQGALRFTDPWAADRLLQIQAGMTEVLEFLQKEGD